jgi:hypothetical protein
VDPHITKPDGESFKFRPNGSDAALILATVVDANGNWCPTAGGLINWSISGPGNYRGGCDQFVDSIHTADKYFHSPGSPELAIEGGMSKVAVRTRFSSGIVTVSASSAGITGGSTSFMIQGDLVHQDVSPTIGDAVLHSQLDVTRRAIRYYLSQSANVSIEILNANGRVLQRISAGNQKQGWHPVTLFNRVRANSGVYIVRLLVDGKHIAAKRTIAVN